MKIKPSTLALASMLAIPGVALAQTTSTTTTAPMGTATSPHTATMSTSPTGSGYSGSSSTTSSYTTADQMTRASKIIGATVYNDQNQSVGSVDELLINNSHDITDAVLSVGGFLGIDSKLVKVPYQDIHVAGDHLVMSGASKNQLKQMPDYKLNPGHAS